MEAYWHSCHAPAAICHRSLDEAEVESAVAPVAVEGYMASHSYPDLHLRHIRRVAADHTGLELVYRTHSLSDIAEQQLLLLGLGPVEGEVLRVEQRLQVVQDHLVRPGILVVDNIMPSERNKRW